MKKVGTSGTVVLPSWTQTIDQQEDRQEKTAFQSVPSLEQKLEHPEQPAKDRHPVPRWVGIVKQWTPAMTVLAWPVIDWIIREDGETEAAKWVYDESAKFFEKQLTSNPKVV